MRPRCGICGRIMVKAKRNSKTCYKGEWRCPWHGCNVPKRYPKKPRKRR